MATPSVETALNKWKRNLVSSIPSIKEGVMSVTKSPMLAAAAKKAEYVAGVQRAADSGKWEEGLAGVSLESWKESTADKGTQRIALGVEKAAPKMQRFLTQLLPYTARVKAEIAAMPKGTLEDGIQRAIAAMTKMSQFKYNRRG